MLRHIQAKEACAQAAAHLPGHSREVDPSRLGEVVCLNEPQAALACGYRSRGSYLSGILARYRVRHLGGYVVLSRGGGGSASHPLYAYLVLATALRKNGTGTDHFGGGRCDARCYCRVSTVARACRDELPQVFRGVCPCP